ncbi:MAG: GNAT family protein [Planctomycetota bacterium]
MNFPITLDHDLALRPYTIDDAARLFAVLDADRASIGEFMLWVHKTDTVEKAREVLAQWIAQSQANGELTLAIEYHGRLVGTVFHCHADREHQRIEIGYWLTSAARGKGIATRAVGKMFDLTFDELGFHRACLMISSRNAKSLALAERLGIEREGVLRDFWTMPGEDRHDAVVYATTADRWPRSSATSESQSETERDTPDGGA